MMFAVHNDTKTRKQSKDKFYRAVNNCQLCNVLFICVIRSWLVSTWLHPTLKCVQNSNQIKNNNSNEIIIFNYYLNPLYHIHENIRLYTGQKLACGEVFQLTCGTSVVLPIRVNIPIFVRVGSSSTNKS